MSLIQEATNFFTAALQCVPFMILAVLAYLGCKEGILKVLAVGWLAILILGFATLALGFSFISLLPAGALSNPGASPTLTKPFGPVGTIIGISTLIAIVLAALAFVPAVRRAFAKVAPFDPQSFVQATALSAVLAISVLCAAPLIALGEPPLLIFVRNMMSGPQAEAMASSMNEASQARTLVYTLMWMVPCTLFAVGLGIVRNLRETRERLGLVMPSLKQVGLGVLVALVMVGVVNGLGAVLGPLWKSIGVETDGKAFSQLMSFAFNPLGALLVGIVAGLGEELAVRGVLQPRIGLLLSNVFFTALHALQYNWDALIVVLLVGAVCGVVRQRANTSTSAITHGVYNFTLLMIAWWTGGAG